MQRDANTFEVAIPFRLLTHVETGAKGRLILNLSFPVSDGEGGESVPGMNSFAYQVRYGAGALTPIYFLELDLEKKRSPGHGVGTLP